MRKALVLIMTAVIIVGLANLVQAPTTPFEWPMFRHDLNHTGYSTSAAPNTNHIAWSYTTGDIIFSSPAVSGGMVYVGSYDHKVYCLDAATGALVWSYTTGDNVDSSPAVAGGMVYVGSYDHKVYAFGPTMLQLAVVSAYDSPSPMSGVFPYGTSITASVTSPVTGPAGTQYVCTGWTGTGDVPASGIGTTLTFTITQNSSITWNWKTQYYLTVENGGHGTAGGQDWYDANTNAQATMTPLTVAGTAGTQYVFNGWTDDASGSGSPSNNILMNGPKTATATWKTQYQVTFKQSGSGVAPKVTYNIDSGLDVQGTVEFSVWVDKDSSIAYTYESPVAGVSGTQYVLTSTSPLSPQTITAKLDVTGSYKTQYQTTVTANPVGAQGGTFKVTYTQCGITYTNIQKTTPWTEWVDACTMVTLTAPLETKVKYHFAEWAVDSTTYPENSIQVHMDGPKTATAVYKDYLGHAKEEINCLRTYATQLYNNRKIGRIEYNHFMWDLAKIEKNIANAIKNLDTERAGYDDKMNGFEDLRHAVMELKHMIKDVKDWAKKGKIPAANAAGIINELETIRMKLVNKARAEALAEKALALNAIADAKAQGKDTAKAEEEITKVNAELDKAMQAITKGNLAQDIQHFKRAFAHSHHAIKKAYDPSWTTDYKDWIDELEEEDS